MKDRITIKDVARRAGVSVSTVSRVINGEKTVAKDLREKVEKAVSELNYIPNINARNIRVHNNSIIGVIIPDVGDDFFSKIIEGMTKKADSLGLNIFVFSCHGEIGHEWNCLKKASRAGISGLIYCPQGEIDARKVYDLFPQDMPLLILYRRDILENVPHIYHDNIKGGYIATKYLLLQGRKNIAFVAAAWGNPFRDSKELIKASKSPNAGIYSAVDRLKGYVKALSEFGVELDEKLIVLSDFGYESGYKVGKTLMSSLIDFDAVIAANDVLATGMIQALSEQKIKIPDKVSIIGFDDSTHAVISRPTLSSVKQRPKHIGEKAVEMMKSLLAGKKVENYVIDVELIVRDSTSQKI